MMGKTHMAAGVASSLIIMQPKSYEECILALIGGAVGGVLADVDILDNDSSDSLRVQLSAMGLTFILLIVDSFFHLGICDSIFAGGYRLPTIGFAIFALLWLIGVFSAHRSFTHSVLALGGYSGAVYLIYPALMPAFAVGYASHLALDLLNKRSLPLLYPFKGGFCLKLCYADGPANKLLFTLGSAVSLIALIYYLIPLVF